MHGLNRTTKVIQTTTYYADEQMIEYYVPLVHTILESARGKTNLYLNTIMNDGTKKSIVNSIQATKTYAALESITMTNETKTSIVNSIHSTRTYVVGTVYSSFDVIIHKSIPMEYLQSTKTYLVDTFQYTFTDRKEREERKMEEEKRMQELLLAVVAATDATAKAEVQQQQMVTTTIFAGACAFLGSVATNYIWAAM